MVRTPKGITLGNALQEIRQEQGFTVRAFAARINRDPGALSRWETGERNPRPEQVAQVLTALGISGHRYEEILSLSYGSDEAVWVATTRVAQRQQLAAVLALERRATRIVEASPLLISGLLQTRDYVRAMLFEGPVSESEIERLVAARMGRQEELARPNPATLVVLLGQSALHQVIGGRQIMIEQLRHLLNMSEHPNVDLRVVPFESGWHPALEGPLWFVESNQVSAAHLENGRSGIFLHEDRDMQAYRKAMEQVRKVAMSAEETMKYIETLVSKMERVR